MSSGSQFVGGPRRRYRARSPWRSVAVVALLVLLLTLRHRFDAPQPPVAAPSPLAPAVYRVERVVDGDTLLLVGGERIRLLGVDTPETVAPDRPPEPWGAEATEFTRQFVAAADARLRLAFDHERFDRHGRQLAWVWHGERLLNEELVRAGLSPAVTKFPYSPSMKDRLRAAERDARRAKRGIWSSP